MDCLISVILPVYNVEKYVQECIQSVFNQSYEDWELIIVDDGSTDSSPEIVNHFAQLDDRIKVVHKKNAGVSSARNTGLKLAKGDYIVFLDADDRLTTNSLKTRLSLISDSQLAIANYRVIGKEQVLHCADSRWTKDDAIRALFDGRKFGYQGYLWNKLFLTSIIKKNGLHFLKGIAYNEDRLFCYSYIQNIDSVGISNEIVYEYRTNDDGAMGGINRLSDKDERKLMTEFVAFDRMISINKKYICDIVKEKYRRAVNLYREVNVKAKIIKKRLKRIARKNGMQYLGINKELSFLEKIKVLYHILLMR